MKGMAPVELWVCVQRKCACGQMLPPRGSNCLFAASHSDAPVALQRPPCESHSPLLVCGEACAGASALPGPGMNCVIKWRSLRDGGGQVSKPGEDCAEMEDFRWNRV